MRLVMLATFAIGMSAFAADQPVKMRDLPPAVQKAVEEQTKGAELKGLSKEVENGKTFYEAETRVSGHGRDILFDSSGAVVEVEEEATLDSVPPAVRAAIQKRAAGGRVATVETVTKGKNVTYEASVVKAGKKSEVKIAADGTIQN